MQQCLFEFGAAALQLVSIEISGDSHRFGEGHVNSAEGFDKDETVPAFEISFSSSLEAHGDYPRPCQLCQSDYTVVCLAGRTSRAVRSYCDVVAFGKSVCELSNGLWAAPACGASDVILV